eukprot:Rmarinus@m.26056
MIFEARTEEAQRPPWYRYAAICLGLCQSISGSGLIWGWSALSQSLKDEGLYEDECDGSDCSGQDAKFLLIFTVGAFANQFSLLFLGLFMDRFGPRRCAVLSGLIVVTGLVLFAMSDDSKFEAFTYGCFLWAFGGQGMQTCVYHVANLFPECRATIMGLVSGAFALSSLVFVGMKWAHQSYDVTVRTILLLYSAWILLIVILGALLWPNRPFPKQEKKVETDDNELMIPPSIEPSVSPKIDESLPAEKTRWELMTSPEYYMFMIYAVIIATWLTFYLGSLSQRADGRDGSDDEKDRLISLVQLLFPLGGLIGPTYGYLIDKFGFTLMLLFTATNSVMYVLPEFNAAIQTFDYVGVVCYVFARSSFYASLFTYLAVSFGFTHYGFLSGMTMIFMAVASLLQYPLVMVADDRFTTPRLIQLGSLLVAYGLILFLHHRWREPGKDHTVPADRKVWKWDAVAGNIVPTKPPKGYVKDQLWSGVLLYED